MIRMNYDFYDTILPIEHIGMRDLTLVANISAHLILRAKHKLHGNGIGQ